MTSSTLHAQLEPIARLHRRLYLWQGLARCWAWTALAVGIVLVTCKLSGWWPPLIVPIVFAAPVIATVVIWALSRKAKPDYRVIAQQLEKENPRLNSVLLAAVAQEPDPKSGEFGFLQLRVIAEALTQNEKNPWIQKRVESLFLAQSMSWLTLLLLVGLMVGLVTAAPRTRSHAFSSTGEVMVTPGNTTVERGSSVVVLARFGSKVPAEATLVVKTETDSRRVRLEKNLDDPIFGGTISDVKEDAHYYIEYDGDETAQFQVQVFDYPKLEKADATLKLPEYTGQPEKSIQNTRRISAVEGSALDYVFHMNKALVSAKLIAKDKSVVALEQDPARSNVFLATFKLDESRQYELLLLDEAGRTNKVPADFVFDVVANRPAELKITFPRQDQRVSALEELTLQAEATDDFGLKAYGIAYTIAGQETKFVEIGHDAPAHEKRQLAYLLPLEEFKTQPDQLVTYYVWADDLVADGQVRRSSSDMYFAEIRPFEEIFREGPQSAEQDQDQQGGGMQQRPSTRLTELQKQIIHATWKLKREETAKKLPENYGKDASVVHQSQEEALRQAEELKEQSTDPRLAPLIDNVVKDMQTAVEHLSKAAKDSSVAPLADALTAEQNAYQRLLQLQAREYQVSRGRRGGGGGGGGSLAQRQLDQLDLKQSENRYETQRQAQNSAAQQSPEQREQLQVLNRLRELAQRQQDINQRLKELQTALTEAKTEQEKEAIRRQLKRLREEQQEMLSDVDELQQRMNQPMNQAEMAEARRQLEETRSEMNRAAEELENGAVSQALASGTRAQRDLQELRDDFRKKSSSQFGDEMREMRADAREIAEKQEKLAKAIEDLGLTQRKSLSDTTNRAELANALLQQKSGLTNLLENMRQLTERSEQAEPLLSRQLYDMLRRTDLNKANTSLDTTGELLRRGFVTQASEAEPQARAVIDDLKRGVERAAESVLGDEVEALRAARTELDELRRQVEEEIARSVSTNSPPDQAGSAGSANAPREGARTGDQNQQQLAQDGGANSPSNQNSAQQPPGEQGSNAQTGSQPGQSAAQSGQNEQSQAQAQSGSPGQEGRGSGSPQEQNGNPQLAQSNQSQNGPAGRGQNREGGQRRSLSGPTGGTGGARNGGGDLFDGGGWGGGPNQVGPLTGGDYVNWTDRLRDVEEMVDLPDLRSQLARIRDRARGIRTDFKRHSKPPQWDLVQAEIISPLTEVYRRVSEELARRESQEAIVPIDRDPVPRRYSELVRRYYEKLGNSQ